MPLTPGTRIGAYDVAGPLGAGGMGEVYRARDTRLDRDVALKVLPAAFTADPDRLARFEREARVLASLNHPNIAQIHGLEETGGTRALVLELVVGPTLAERLEQGPIPLDEVLSIARQIALALQAAHEAGVIHRDLKPANVKVRKDGTVKVLDFGLAKALDTAPAPTPDADPLQSPTLTAPVTRMGGGLILGTPAYMSPEQAEGQPTDTRGDLWSFGVVLYEMLAGERLFAGETVAQVLARVIDRDLDLSVLPPSTPRPVRRLLGRCLERDRRRRMRDAGEALSDLEAADSPSEALPEAAAGAAASPSPLRGWRARTVWAAGGLAIGCLLAATALWTLAPSPEPPAVRRLTLDLPSPMARGSGFALSPDGSTLAYVGRTGGGRTRQLMVRHLNEGDARALDGTEGALDPFFSPDGTWIGFFAGSGPPGGSDRIQYRWTLKRVPIRGGAAVTLADNVPALRGSWGDDDRIVIGALGGLLRVPAAGGPPEAVLPAGAVPEVTVCSAPHVLPGSRALLYAELSTDGDSQLKAVSLADEEHHVVASDVAGATYTPTGHLLLQQSTRPAAGRPGPRTTTLLAAPFDAERLELTRAPVPVVPNAGSSAWSADGTLLYAADADDRAWESRRRLVWIDRDGREDPVPTAARVRHAAHLAHRESHRAGCRRRRRQRGHRRLRPRPRGFEPLDFRGLEHRSALVAGRPPRRVHRRGSRRLRAVPQGGGRHRTGGTSDREPARGADGFRLGWRSGHAGRRARRRHDERGHPPAAARRRPRFATADCDRGRGDPAGNLAGRPLDRLPVQRVGPLGRLRTAVS